MHRGILPQTQLSHRRFPPRPPPQPPRHSLLQHLHHHRRIRLLRLPNQQMNVLRHHDVADDDEPIPPPHFIKNDQKRIPRPHRPQKRQTPITTESNEMQLRSPIAPLEILRHREKVNFLPPFANPAKDGAPARAKTKLRSNLLEWYHPRRTAVNCGNHAYETRGRQRGASRFYALDFMGAPSFADFAKGGCFGVGVGVGVGVRFRFWFWFWFWFCSWFRVPS